MPSLPTLQVAYLLNSSNLASTLNSSTVADSGEELDDDDEDEDGDKATVVFRFGLVFILERFTNSFSIQANSSQIATASLIYKKRVK